MFISCLEGVPKSSDLNRVFKLIKVLLASRNSYPTPYELAVYRFLNNEIRFTDIPKLIEKACSKHDWEENPDFEYLIELEIWSKEFVNSYKSKEY